jgi:ribonuclease E
METVAASAAPVEEPVTASTTDSKPQQDATTTQQPLAEEEAPSKPAYVPVQTTLLDVFHEEQPAAAAEATPVHAPVAAAPVPDSVESRHVGDAEPAPAAVAGNGLFDTPHAAPADAPVSIAQHQPHASKSGEGESDDDKEHKERAS